MLYKSYKHTNSVEAMLKKISQIGSLLKKVYRSYSHELVARLQEKGFSDLRPSFLEVLLYICEHDAPAIKDIGSACGLKKQTMTSHLNELEHRGYIYKKVNESDKREQKVFLTEYGEKFRFKLLETISDLENKYVEIMGEVELARVEHLLLNFHDKIAQEQTTLNQ